MVASAQLERFALSQAVTRLREVSRLEFIAGNDDEGLFLTLVTKAVNDISDGKSARSTELFQILENYKQLIRAQRGPTSGAA